MENIFRTFIISMVFIFGTSIFSFLNVLIYRIPQKKSWIKERSFCTKCGHKLRWYDLFPVLSYLFLGGRCRYCKEKISPSYMIVELIGGISGLLIFYRFFPVEHFFGCLNIHGEMRNDLLRTIFVFVLFSLITVVAFIDMNTMEINNGASIIATIMGIISLFLFKDITVKEHIIGFFAVSMPLLILTLIIPGAFGGGDIKFMFGIGGILGWKNALLALFIGIISGGIWGIILLITKKKGRKDHFAFGPFLCIGIGIAVLYGENIINWYLSMY